MFFVDLEGNWASRMIRVPEFPDGHAHTCFQMKGETATADCFYLGVDDDGEESVGLHHISLRREDVVL
jgi:hypothetical protein